MVHRGSTTSNSNSSSGSSPSSSGMASHTRSSTRSGQSSSSSPSHHDDSRQTVAASSAASTVGASATSGSSLPENLLPRAPPFLRKLRLILETTPEEVAGWNETGTVFEVLDPRRFGVELAKHFKGTVQTFVRQLHFYGFTKFDCNRNVRAQAKPEVPRALPGAWSFSHPMMLRDVPDLMHNIQRQPESRPGRMAHHSKNLAKNHQMFSNDDDEEDEVSFSSESSKENTIKQLEATVTSLKSRLDVLINFLQKEGYDPSSILETGPQTRSSKKQKVEDEEVNPSSGSKRPRDQKEAIELNPPSLSLSRQTSLDFFLQENSTMDEVPVQSEDLLDLFEKDPASLFQPPAEDNELTSVSFSQIDEMGLLANSLETSVSLDGPEFTMKSEPQPFALGSPSLEEDEAEEGTVNELFGINLDSATFSKAIEYIRQAVDLVNSNSASSEASSSSPSSLATTDSEKPVTASKFTVSLEPVQAGDLSLSEDDNDLIDEAPRLKEVSPIETMAADAKSASKPLNQSVTIAAGTTASVTLSKMAKLLPLLRALSRARNSASSAPPLVRVRSLSPDRFSLVDTAVTVSAL